MAHPKNEFLLDRREAARFLGCPVKRIRSLVEQGKLSPWILEGKEYFHQEELFKRRMNEREVEINTSFSRILRVMGYGLKIIAHGRNGRHRHLSPEDWEKGG